MLVGVTAVGEILESAIVQKRISKETRPSVEILKPRASDLFPSVAKEADWTTPVQLEDSDTWVMGSEAVQRGGGVITSEMDIPVDLIEGSV